MKPSELGSMCRGRMFPRISDGCGRTEEKLRGKTLIKLTSGNKRIQRRKLLRNQEENFPGRRVSNRWGWNQEKDNNVAINSLMMLIEPYLWNRWWLVRLRDSGHMGKEDMGVMWLDRRKSDVKVLTWVLRDTGWACFPPCESYSYSNNNGSTSTSLTGDMQRSRFSFRDLWWYSSGANGWFGGSSW